MSTDNPNSTSAQRLTSERHPGGFELSAAERAAIEHEMSHYEDPRAASIGALKIVQQARGWVPDGAIAAIGNLIGIPASDVEGVATFYNLIFRQPVGRHVIKLCDSIACFLTGYDELKAALTNPSGHRLRSDHGRWPLHPAADLLSGQLRQRADADDR
jgi:NADH-quinone oxidoreductase subunit E